MAYPYQSLTPPIPERSGVGGILSVYDDGSALSAKPEEMKAALEKGWPVIVYDGAGTQKYVSGVSQDGEIEYVQGGSTNYVETFLDSALCIPKVLNYNMGQAIKDGDISVYIQIDVTPLGVPGVTVINGWAQGGPEVIFLSYFFTSTTDVSDAQGFFISWEGEYSNSDPDHRNVDAGCFAIGYTFMGGEIISLNNTVMQILDMQVDIYHHTMPEQEEA